MSAGVVALLTVTPSAADSVVVVAAWRVVMAVWAVARFGIMALNVTIIPLVCNDLRAASIKALRDARAI